MVLTIYTCRECREPVADESKDRASRPMFKICPKCGKHATCKGVGGSRNASTGEIVSDNLGCGIGQETQGNRDLAEAGIDARYRESDGALVAANRQAFQEATACRGMVSHTDGGFSGRRMSRIRENSKRGNPRAN